MKQIAAVELERFVALADLLETVPAKDFDIRSWVQHLPRDRQTMALGLIVTRPACGFAGCAMGWAAHAQIIAGLEVRGGSIIYQETGKIPLTAWEAVTAAMGIKGSGKRVRNTHFAEYLFYSHSYKTNPTPKMVAARLRRFIRKIAAIRARDRRRATPVQRELKLVVPSNRELEVA